MAAPPRHLIRPSLQSSIRTKDPGPGRRFHQHMLQTTLSLPNTSNMEYRFVKQATMHEPHDHKKHFSEHRNNYKERLTGLSVWSHKPNEVKESILDLDHT